MEDQIPLYCLSILAFYLSNTWKQLGSDSRSLTCIEQYVFFTWTINKGLLNQSMYEKIWLLVIT